MRHGASLRPNAWTWLALGLVILFVVVIRVRLLGILLERDEGEFAYIGQLMLEGIAPYKMAYVIKLPGTAAVYALSMALFGQTPVGIHLGLLLANVTAIVLLFLLAKRWFNEGVGLIAAATYGLMSLSWCCAGTAAHATQFVVPAALGGILLVLRGLQSGRLAALFWGGILLGLAFLLKQPGLLFAAFGGFCIVTDDWKSFPADGRARFRRVAVFCIGVVLPFAALCLGLWWAGVFDRFWYWSFTVAGGGWTALATTWANLMEYSQWLWVTRELLLWIVAGLSLAGLWWMALARPVRLRFLAFCGASILATSLGLRFNPHYFVLVLPAAGMLIGLGVMEARRLLMKLKAPAWVAAVPVALFGALCGYALWADAGYFFTDPPLRVGRNLYFHNPFEEAAQVADYIKKNSAPDSRIAVLGSEPEIYFLSHRRSATGHVSVYILMEGRPWSHAMQEEMGREIITAAPEYIVVVKNYFSWLMSATTDPTLVKNVIPYVRARYKLVGLAISPPTPGDPAYYWDAAAPGPHPELTPKSNLISLYKLQKPAADKN